MFEYEFPVYVLVEHADPDPADPDHVSLRNLLTLSAAGHPDAIALFTDRAAAEQFRDEHVPGHQPFEIPTPDALRAVLDGSRAAAGAVALDPYRLGNGVRTVGLGDMLRSIRPAA